MTETLAQTDAAARFILDQWTDCRAAFGIVLGSGLGGFADALAHARDIDTGLIPHWPASTVEGHRGKLVLGEIDGRPVLAQQGRIHFYEGYSIEQVVFPVRVMARLGVRFLVLTNAAGGIRQDLEPGDLLLITDHINCMAANPLVGPNEPAFGERFPDMSAPYDAELLRFAEAACMELRIPVKKGVLAATPGPNYETAAEVRMLRGFGADVVCMSTVPEAIAAAHLGLRVLGISSVANPATGVGSGKLTHDEVRRNAGRTQEKLFQLVRAVLRRIPT